MIERAVLDLCSPQCTDQHRYSATLFLQDETVRSLCDVWEVWLPWSKIYQLTRHPNNLEAILAQNSPKASKKAAEVSIVKGIIDETSPGH